MVPNAMERRTTIQGTAPPRGLPRTVGPLLLAIVTACAQTGRTPAPDEDAAHALAAAARAAGPDEVVVQLAFGGGADLDLYVTGPLEETVYFANTPTKIGGRLLQDQRCDHPAPRVETVVFEEAPPGRYRIGIDFPETCDDGPRETSWHLRVDVTGEVTTRTGTLRLRVFDPIVIEVERRP